MRWGGEGCARTPALLPRVWARVAACFGAGAQLYGMFGSGGIVLRGHSTVVGACGLWLGLGLGFGLRLGTRRPSVPPLLARLHVVPQVLHHC